MNVPSKPKTKHRFAKISDLAGAVGKLPKPVPWKTMLAIAREDRFLTLEETFGSVKPRVHPLDFKVLRESAIEEKVQRFANELNH